MTRIARVLATSALFLATTTSFAADQLSVSRAVTVDDAPAAVWQKMGDFNSLDKWHPAVAKSTVSASGNKVGTTRVLTLGDGATITEKLVAYDPAKHSYTYEILESPLPVQNYRSTIRLEPAADGKTVVTWNSTFEAKGAPNDKAKETIQGVYDAGLGSLAGKK